MRLFSLHIQFSNWIQNDLQIITVPYQIAMHLRHFTMIMYVRLATVVKWKLNCIWNIWPPYSIYIFWHDKIWIRYKQKIKSLKQWVAVFVSAYKPKAKISVSFCLHLKEKVAHDKLILEIWSTPRDDLRNINLYVTIE